MTCPATRFSRGLAPHLKAAETTLKMARKLAPKCLFSRDL